MSISAIEVSDIQATVLRPRPSPYKGEYVVLRIDDAVQGREMLRRIIPYVAPAEEWWVPSIPAWLGIAFSYHGLKALGLPQASLDSFPEEFRQGMAARADKQQQITSLKSVSRDIHLIIYGALNSSAGQKFRKWECLMV